MMSQRQRRRIARRAYKRDPLCPRTHTGRLVNKLVALSGGYPVYTSEHYEKDENGRVRSLLPVPLYEEKLC